jgi:hypothetical protein
LLPASQFQFENFALNSKKMARKIKKIHTYTCLRCENPLKAFFRTFIRILNVHEAANFLSGHFNISKWPNFRSCFQCFPACSVIGELWLGEFLWASLLGE